MATLSFTATIRIRGINPYVDVSAARAAKLRPGRRTMPVLVRVNGKPGKPWRINLVPTGTGAFYLYLAEPVRKASGTGVGDRVRVELDLDEAYRPGPQRLPPWFAAALKADPAAQANWKRLTPSRRKEVVRYLRSLRSEEARRRNVERALRVLGGRQERFMARAWAGGK